MHIILKLIHSIKKAKYSHHFNLILNSKKCGLICEMYVLRGEWSQIVTTALMTSALFLLTLRSQLNKTLLVSFGLKT